MNRPNSQTAKMLVVFPRGQLSKSEKGRLLKHGILATEADNPKDVVATIPGMAFVSDNDIMCAALEAIVKDGSFSVSRTFTKALSDRLVKEKK